MEEVVREFSEKEMDDLSSQMAEGGAAEAAVFTKLNKQLAGDEAGAETPNTSDEPAVEAPRTPNTNASDAADVNAAKTQTQPQDTSENGKADDSPTVVPETETPPLADGAPPTALTTMPRGKINVEVTPEFIAAQPEELRPYLKGIEGETLSERMLKTYVNEQWKIEQLKRSAGDTTVDALRSPSLRMQQEAAELSSVANTPGLDEFINRTVAQTLRSKYPDLPPNADQQTVDDYVKDLSFESPRRAHQFLADEQAARTSTVKEVGRVQYLQTNWVPLAVKSVEQAVQRVDSELKAHGVTLKDLGIDLTLDDKLYNQFLYDKILTVDSNTLNPKTVARIGKALVLNADGIADTLRSFTLEKLATYAQNKSTIVQRGKPKGPPSLGQAPSGNSARVAERLSSGVKKADIESLTPDAPMEAIDAALKDLVKQASASAM
jgi:hypothetical protein